MKDLELLAILGGGAVIGAIILKTNPTILKNITDRIPTLAPQPQIIPVSDVLPRAPIPQSKHCPPGMYADYTDGILTCRDAHGTRELDSRVKKMIPDQQYAFGKTVDNDYWGYASSPISDEIARLPDLRTILPPSSKDVQKTIDHQKKKKKDHKLVDEKPSKIKKEYDPHKRKLAEVPSGGISVQMECPHDLSKLNCGSHCTKNGKVYQVVCGAIEKPHRTPSRPTRPPTLTIPPNYPGSVSITPGETPYPEEDVGGTAPQDTTGQDQPDWNPPDNETQPDTSGVVTTPPTPLPHRQPQIGRPTKEPTRQPQIGSGPLGKFIYVVTKNFPISNPTGRDEEITYKSDKKHRKIISHRTDVYGIGPEPSLEAHVYMKWPTDYSQCAKGHPELTIKFWGPEHTNSNCCYCLTSAVPDENGNLQLGFGGEGPHPETSTIKGKGAKLVNTVPLTPGQLVGIKGVIWKNSNGTVHQEIWYDMGGRGWQLGGTWDRENCGKDKTSTSPHQNQEIEFRCDCKNVTYSGIAIAAIKPGVRAFGNLGYIDPNDFF